jgi:hypothetical protein
MSRCDVRDPGGSSFWFTDTVSHWLTKCLVGWSNHLELGEDSGPLGGTATGEPCASVCFPGWH